MGLFDKLKNLVSKKETIKEEDSKEKEQLEVYEKGLEKSRKEFVSKLSLLGVKYTKVSEEYFEELEQVLMVY